MEVLQASRPGAKSAAILNISWVSHRWRNITFSTPNLWSCIDVPNMGVIQTFMTRAKSMPLSITLNNVRLENRLPIATILKSIHNIRHLDLSAERGAHLNKMEEFVEMTYPAPALESLYLEGICLPETLFSGSIPSLRHLHLKSFLAEWKTIPDCPQLRSFCVIAPEIPVLVSELLGRLSTFPLLESLELRSSFEEDLGFGALPDPVELPNLKYLIVNFEETCDVVPLLRQLRIPSACKVELEVNQFESDEHLLLFPALSTCRKGTSGHTRELRIVVDGWIGIKIFEGIQKPKEYYNARGSTGYIRPDIQFRIWSPWGDETANCSTHQAARICQNHLDLGRLESIDLMAIAKDFEDYPPDSFWELINSLSTLRVLKVRQNYARSFVEYLSTSTALASPDGSIVPFHMIDKLVYEDPSNDIQQYPPRLTMLMHYLRVRMDKGFQLESLTLVRVGKDQPPDGCLQDLRTLVRYVKWKVKPILYARAELVE
ncbi:hypothetical protein BDN72DRAFT_848004 [Pluteus cervinus]|uniref:Uncharacterized protein n=1 Tax=Pluteus cervinus TaxID=181527 RepID=A0ACD3ABK9_9AGAR|nr:hypothetical protein BDN72DRAFT_848004 [Pluteus cervinus]